MQAAEDKEHFLFDCPVYLATKKQASSCLDTINVALPSFFEHKADQTACVKCYAICALMPGCQMNHM